LGIRNTVTVDLGIIVKRYLLVGVLIFGLVASVGAFIPEVFAETHPDEIDDDDERGSYDSSDVETIEAFNEEFSLIKSIIAGWNSAIEAMDLALQSFENRLTGVEAQMVEDKATIESLQTQVDDLSGASGIESSSGILAITESYTNTVSTSVASDSVGTLSASCNEGDLAVSGQFVVISGNVETMTIYSDGLSDMYTYSVEAENEDSANSFDIDVSVNCIMATDSDVSKSGINEGISGLS